MQINHLVLTVENLKQTVDFYTRALGMWKEVFGKERVALIFGAQKINIRSKGE